MGFRFRKSFKVAPGVKLNFNKKSTGVTFGGKGLHYTVNSSGKKTASAGIPGTGLYYTKSSGGSSKKKHRNSKDDSFMQKIETIKNSFLKKDNDSGAAENTYNNFNGYDASKYTNNYDSFSGMNLPPQNPNGSGGSSGNNVPPGGSNNFKTPKEKKPFYERLWFAILMLFVFAPAGVFLLWKYTKGYKAIKIIVSIVFLSWFLLFSSAFIAAINELDSEIPSDTQAYEDVANENIPTITETETLTETETETEIQTEKSTQPTTEKPTNKQPTTERDNTPAVKPTKPAEPTTTKPTQAEITYVLNTNTKVYHTMSCRHVKNIKPENYQESKTVPSDYKPCGTCHPGR